MLTFFAGPNDQVRSEDKLSLASAIVTGMRPGTTSQDPPDDKLTRFNDGHGWSIEERPDGPAREGSISAHMYPTEQRGGGIYASVELSLRDYWQFQTADPSVPAFGEGTPLVKTHEAAVKSAIAHRAQRPSAG